MVEGVLPLAALWDVSSWASLCVVDLWYQFTYKTVVRQRNPNGE
jgi:hypothetical protein